MKKLVLFDVDGTLIEQDKGLSKLHIDSFTYGFKNVYGVNATIYETNYMGKTDKQIIREVLVIHELDNDTIDANFEKMFESTIGYFKNNIKNISDDVGLINGVKECLYKLDKNNDYILGLVTGNTKEIARLKLEKLGIWHYFKIGGFGDATESRAELVKECTNQVAEKYKITMPKDKVYVVGDTPFDIHCAKENDAVSIAVTTGKYRREDLAKYKPDYLINNLLELPDLLDNEY